MTEWIFSISACANSLVLELGSTKYLILLRFWLLAIGAMWIVHLINGMVIKIDLLMTDTVSSALSSYSAGETSALLPNALQLV
jgi:hypothetical protein